MCVSVCRWGALHQDFSTLKERTGRAVNVMIKAQRLTTEVAEREAAEAAAEAEAEAVDAALRAEEKLRKQLMLSQHQAGAGCCPNTKQFILNAQQDNLTEQARTETSDRNPLELEPPKADLAAADLAAAFAAAAATCSGDLPPGFGVDFGADFLGGVGAGLGGMGGSRSSRADPMLALELPRRVPGLSNLAPLARPKAGSSKGGSSSGLGNALGLGDIRDQLQGTC